jgi:hypothetical protein
MRDRAEAPAPVLDVRRGLHGLADPVPAERVRPVEHRVPDVREPLERVVAAVVRTVAVRPLVVARRVHRRRAQRVEVALGAHVEGVVTEAPAALLEVADVRGEGEAAAIHVRDQVGLARP